MAAAATKAAAPATPQGTINFFTFAGDQRAGIQAGTAVPNGSYYPKRAEGPYNGFPAPDSGDDDTAPVGDVLNNYNMVLKGYFYPPKTGKLMLAIATDDPGQLYFSTDDNPANKTLVASESQWNPVRAFGGTWDGSVATRRTVVSTGDPNPRPQNWSAYINVTKGKPYYIEGVGTEFGGGDNLAIAFRYEGDPDFEDGGKPISGQYLSPFSLPTVATIIGQPQDAAVYVGSTATFSVAVDAPPGVTISSIKWTKNGADVPDSDKTSISLSGVGAGDDGAKLKATITTSAGTLTSSEATLFVSAFTSEFAQGVVKFEAWTGIGSTAVSALLEDAHYQDKADDIRLLPATDTPNGYADNYGAKVSGFIIPAETGSYNFFIRSDDASQFFLSTSEKVPDPAVDPVIAEETGCCDAFHEADGSPETTQTPIAMVAGKKYAFLAFVKEGGGGDYLQLAMRQVGDTTPAGSLKPISGTLVGANARPTKGEPQITKQPVLPAKMEEGQPWSVSVDGVVTPAGYNYPLLVQWQKNGANIPGANGKTFTIKSVVPGDSGTYRAVVSAPSGKSANSVELNAQVISDKVAPTLANALKSFSSDTKVNVIFSEAVSATSANTAGNYKINNGITVSTAKLTANPKIVELTTSAIAKGSKNQLTVTGVQDLFNNAVAASTSIEIGFQKGVYLVTTDPAEEGGPLNFAGDNAINQHLIDRGFDVFLMQGARVPDDGSSALGRDLIIETSTLGSGTVEVDGVGKFKNLTIPAMNWEASSTDAFGFMAANASPGTTASQSQVNIVDDTHQMAAGFPKGLLTVTAPETYSQAQPVNAHVIATLAADPSQAIIFYYDKGEKGANDFVMPARRAFFFFQDNTAAAANENGWKLFDAAVDWLLGIQAPVTPPPSAELKFTSIKLVGSDVVVEWSGGGTLQAAADITGPWVDVPGAASGVKFPANESRRFARIRP